MMVRHEGATIAFNVDLAPASKAASSLEEKGELCNGRCEQKKTTSQKHDRWALTE